MKGIVVCFKYMTIYFSMDRIISCSPCHELTEFSWRISFYSPLFFLSMYIYNLSPLNNQYLNFLSINAVGVSTIFCITCSMQFILFAGQVLIFPMVGHCYLTVDTNYRHIFSCILLKKLHYLQDR